MNPSQLPSSWVGLIVLLLVLWRVAVRVKRLTTRQPVRVWALRLRLVLLGILLVLFAALSLSDVMVLGALVAGALSGVLAGLMGLRGSAYEATPEGLFYTPHRGLGAAIALLFVARLGYRFLQYSTRTPNASTHALTFNPQGLGLTPLTIGVFALFCGYVMTYSVGILRWRARQLRMGSMTTVSGS